MAARNLVEIDETNWQRLDAAVRQLEQSWEQAQPADLAQLTPPSGDPLRERALIALIKIDQECRWQSGKPKVLEAYLGEWPELLGRPEALTELLVSECLTRATLGSSPTKAELDSRFPEISDRIDLAAVLASAEGELPVNPREFPQSVRDTSRPTLDYTVTREAPISPPLVGRRFGRYEVRELLGQGGMGSVYRAFDTQLEREVALKVPRFDPHTEPAIRERFLREARAAAIIRHPNVCPVFDTGQIDGTYFLTMALIEGCSLANWMEGRGLLARDAAAMVLKISRALDAVHAEGILHRDIKPSNIMIDEHGEPLLMDFGLARLAESKISSPALVPTTHTSPGGSPDLTGAGEFIGTLPYMSRERVDGQPADVRGDVYSLGVIFYQLLTGRPPFSGSFSEILAGIRHADPPPPSALCSNLDPTIEGICLKAMAKDCDSRHQTAAELAESLERYLVTDSSPKAHRRRSRWIALALAVAAVFALLGLLLTLTTAKGTLVLEVEPADVRVEIDGSEIHLKSPRDDIRLAVGEHELIVKKEGFETRTQSFQVRRNGKTEIVARLPPDERLLFEDSFPGDSFNRQLWTTGRATRYSHGTSGKTTAHVEQKSGCLLLQAAAEHEGGWSCSQLIWLDSMQDLRTGGDVTVEVEWAAEANVGLAGIELTDGSDPVDSEDSKAVRLLSLTGEKFAPLFSNRQRVWIDICGSANTATLYAPEDILARCASVDLSKLSVWKLRFLVIAGTSSGLPPSRVAARIHRVRATSIPSRSAVAGRVTDTITNRGIAGAVIRFGSDKVVSNPDGSFLLRTAPGKQLLHAEASGYTEVEPPLTTVSPGLRTSAELRMKRTRVGYGQVIASIPLAQKIDSFAPGPRGIYFTTSWEHGSRFLWHLPFTGGPATELGTISLAPAQKDFQDALTTGSPQFYDVGRGMAYADNVLYGIGAWPARIFRITAKGELSLVHRLPIDWPQGLVFDGKRFWFLENSGIDNRCGLQAIDAQTGQLVVNLPANDNKISGLAWGMGRFWVSSMAGRVYEIDIEQAADRKSLEGGSVNQFPGCYSQIAFDGGYLWGLDSDAKRLCKIKVGRDSE